MRTGFVIALLVTGSTAALAAVEPRALCAAGKLSAAGKAAGSFLRCHSRAARAGGTVAADCLDAASTTLAEKFASAEVPGGCITSGDAPRVDAALRALAADTGARIAPDTSPSPCASRKLLAARKLALTILRAEARHQRQPDAQARAATIARALTDLDTAFATLDATGTCPTTGDASAVATLISSSTTTPATGIARVMAILVPTCGDGIAAGTESCDALDNPGACDGCAPDCSCGPAACGDGILASTEECEEGMLDDPRVGCLDICQCDDACELCVDSIGCNFFPCCDPQATLCLGGGPAAFMGACAVPPTQVRCSIAAPCSAGYVCLAPLPPEVDPERRGYCVAELGSICRIESWAVPCLSPATCSGTSGLGTCQ